jgi:hypothetical protein
MKRFKNLLFVAVLLVLLLAACKPLNANQADLDPQVTDTQEIVHASPTSLPSETALPSETSAPKISPTEQSVPTGTLPPKQAPTAVSLDTTPGSLLHEGEYWRQNDVSLVLENTDFYPDQSCIAFEFDLANNSTQDLIITILASQFTLTDNIGGTWTARMLSAYSFCGTPEISGTSQLAVSLAAGESFWAGGYTTWILSFDGPLTDPAVTELTITVNGLSHFTDAKWVVPIAR